MFDTILEDDVPLPQSKKSSDRVGLELLMERMNIGQSFIAMEVDITQSKLRTIVSLFAKKNNKRFKVVKEGLGQCRVFRIKDTSESKSESNTATSKPTNITRKALAWIKSHPPVGKAAVLINQVAKLGVQLSLEEIQYVYNHQDEYADLPKDPLPEKLEIGIRNQIGLGVSDDAIISFAKKWDVELTLQDLDEYREINIDTTW